MAKQKHVVVLGAGFGGLTFVQKLKHPNARITIVDRENHHLFQPLLYQVATGGLAQPEIAEPVRTILANRDDVHVLMDTAKSIDTEKRTVELSHQTLQYDYLVVALGMVNSYFGNSEWAQHTIGLKSLNEARRIRQRVLYAFERAEAIHDEAERKRLMTVVVVGAGPSGVEMAGALSELTKRVFKKDFRSIKPEESRIVLVEAADRVLPTYSDTSSRKAEQSLRKLGVELMIGQSVDEIREGQIRVGEKAIEAESLIWTAGVEANPLVRQLPGKHNRKGQIAVEPDCSLPGHPEVFAIGDIVDLTDPKGQQVPGVSPAAMQMGKHVAKIISKELDGANENRQPFSYRDKGSMATIGRSKAVAEIGKLKFSGFPAWFLWLAVHLVFLIGFRNRLAVLLQWMYAYIRYRPGARVFEKPERSDCK